MGQNGRHDPHRDQQILRVGAALEEAKGAVVLIHGRGASAEDILGLSREMDHPGLVYLAPQAAGHTWYPERFLVPTEENEPWLSSALDKVKATVGLAMSAGIPAARIAICGFSQGACLASEFVVRNPARWGGLIALTGGLIGSDEEVEASALRSTGGLDGMPALLASGVPDPHIPWPRVLRSAEILTAMGASVSVESYPGRPHTVSRVELEHADLIVRSLLAGDSVS